MAANASDFKKYDKMDELDVVLLAQNGNQTACEYLIRKCSSIVHIKANTYFMAGADREDVEQEGMLGLFKAISSYDETKGASFRTFAEICITGQIQSAIKLASRNKHKPLNEYTSLSQPMGDGEGEEGALLIDAFPDPNNDDPLIRLVDNEEMHDMKVGINSVASDFERRVIAMYIEGMSYQEIAEALKKSPKQIDNALQRVKKKLGKYLENH